MAHLGTSTDFGGSGGGILTTNAHKPHKRNSAPPQIRTTTTSSPRSPNIRMPHGTPPHPQTHVHRLTGLGQGLSTPPILLVSLHSADNARYTLNYIDDALIYDSLWPQEYCPRSTRPAEDSQDDDRHPHTQDTSQGDKKIGELGGRRLDEAGRAREADPRGE